MKEDKENPTTQNIPTKIKRRRLQLYIETSDIRIRSLLVEFPNLAEILVSRKKQHLLWEDNDGILTRDFIINLINSYNPLKPQSVKTKEVSVWDKSLPVYGYIKDFDVDGDVIKNLLVSTKFGDVLCEDPNLSYTNENFKKVFVDGMPKSSVVRSIEDLMTPLATHWKKYPLKTALKMVLKNKTVFISFDEVGVMRFHNTFTKELLF